MFGFEGVRVFGFEGVRMSGFEGVRVFGFEGVRVFGLNLVLRLISLDRERQHLYDDMMYDDMTSMT